MVTFLIELMIFCLHIENKNDALKNSQLPAFVNLNRYETLRYKNLKKTLRCKKTKIRK